jgi:hypothetical protein
MAGRTCLSYEIVRDRDSKFLDLKPRHRKCRFLYHYQIHPQFGFMHARMQTWFPFAIQVSSIVGLANRLNITTTAEGIETIDQLNLIRATGCTEAQGYLFSVPLSLQNVCSYFAGSSQPRADADRLNMATSE